MFSQEHSGRIYLSSGSWNDDIQWKFFLTTKLPPIELCTAVACVAVLRTNDVDKLVLTKNQRGWEMPGGHIEKGETLEQAMMREAEEEGGITPHSLTPFGYREITAKKPMPHDQQGGFYPFPVSYVPHFIAIATEISDKPLGKEILECRAFDFTEISNLSIEAESIILAGLDTYTHLH